MFLIKILLKARWKRN